MKKEGFSVLLVPRTDEFQGEYIAPYSERLAWLTGFNGSAGFAIITLKKAAFFTDGRYTLQAKDEVPDIYEIYNTSQKTSSQWALENLSPNDKIGYDPWLFTEKQLESYKNPLIPFNKNPIDSLWVDRPLPPQDFIKIQLHILTMAACLHSRTSAAPW